MNLKKSASLVLALLASVWSCAAHAADDASQLGNSLTAWGAEKAGNADGSIPAWTGGVKAPPGADLKSGRWPDPFPNDKPLYSITADTLAKYESKLTPGTVAMFKRYPNFRIDVYPTRRGYWLSKEAEENTIKNAKNPACKLEKGGDQVVGCWAGVPFPIARSGYEAMWNHALMPLGNTSSFAENWIVNSAGARTMILAAKVDSEFAYWTNRFKPYDGMGNYWRRYVSYSELPVRDAGTINMYWYPLDYAGTGSKSWSYTPGQRRVRMTPEFTYDTPIATLGAGMFFDEISMFTGRMDRHDYKLVGKKEMIVPYNSYRNLNAASAENLLGPQFVNPDIQRWELHRVWQVEATVKPGVRHAAAKRNFYLDEDSWTILANESYDSSGSIFRVLYGAGVPQYFTGGWNSVNSAQIAYDLVKGQYLAMGLIVNPADYIKVEVPPPALADLTAEGLVAKGVR